jgi:hypothetical protein
MLLRQQVKLPGPDHHISIERNPARVVVSVAGRVVADTRNALTLREPAYQQRSGRRKEIRNAVGPWSARIRFLLLYIIRGMLPFIQSE